MARTRLNAPRPADDAGNASPSPIAWSALIAMREDGTLEVRVKGETGHQMMKAAMEALRAIDRLRQEPAYDFRKTHWLND